MTKELVPLIEAINQKVGNAYHGYTEALRAASDEIERLRVKADQWDALIRDIGAPLCSYPCLRDDLSDWLMKRAADEPGKQP